MEAITLAKIIDFNKFKAEQTYKKSANVHSIAQSNKILNLDEDLDLSDEWDNAEDMDCMGSQYSEAKSNSHSNTTFSKIFGTILLSIKKFTQQKT